MGTTDLSAVQDWLEQNEAPEEVIAAFDGSKLRQQLTEAHGRIKELEPLQAEVERYKKAPIREEAFKAAGVDFSKLRKSDRTVLEQFTWEGDKPAEDVVKAFVQEWELPTGEQATPAQTAPAAQIAQHATAQAAAAPAPADALDQIAALEKEGKFMEAMRLKNQLVWDQTSK